MPLSAKKVAAGALLTLGLFVLYWQVFRRLIDAWVVDGNYSHGFLIIPIAAYLVWERRARLQALAVRPSSFGLLIFGGGVVLLLAGVLGSELFLTRLSLIATLTGMVLFLFGWAHVRILAFPLAFLLLMIPLPAIIFNQIAFPLQLLASRLGEFAIASANIPVLREGNVLVLANTSLEVAEACSGIRSLISLITLGIVYGYFTDSRGWVRTSIVLSTIPVAIVANGARVAGTGMLAHWWGPEAAEGFFHEFSGWVVFIVAFVMILAIQRLIVRLAPDRKTMSDASGAVVPGVPVEERI
jgi:exosortase